LSHWVKAKESGESYQFARFNRKTEVIQYTDAEYAAFVEPLTHQTISNSHACDWTRAETDLLFDLCERF